MTHDPKTVKVPPEMRALFARAEETVAAYFASRREAPEHGTIEVFDERYVLVRGASLSVEFFKVARDLYGPGREEEAQRFARNILFDLAHAIGKSDAQAFHRKMGLVEPTARLSAGPVHFAHTGWAFVDIHPESALTSDEHCFSIYDHPYSFESHAWLAARERADFPVCIMSAGYSSGWCEESYGVELVAAEILCRARGDECCRFVLAHPKHIESRVAKYLHSRPDLVPRARNFEIPDLFARKRLEEELKRSRDELEVRVIERTAELVRANERLQRERVEREVAEGRLRQVDKLEAIGRLAGGIAHDFNNLLTVIDGYAELARGSLSGDAPAHACVEEIRAACSRAKSLTAQLLAFSRQQVAAPTVVDLNALIANLVVMLRRLIGEDVELVVESGHPLERVWADPTQLEQVLVNLIVNARDALPNGGRIVVATRNVDVEPERRFGFDTLAPGRYVELSVRDDGVGMDETTLARLFEPFFTTKPRGKGTGLGLATVHGIVTATGGAITVASRIGRGSTFRIGLPKCDGEHPGRGALGAVAGGSGVGGAQSAGRSSGRGSGLVLFAEDEPSLRRLVLNALLSVGYDVLEAADGREALERFGREKDRIDLLLTDVVMPHLNGRELAERVRAERPDLPVLLVSGYTDDLIDRRAIAEAGFDFLPKPFTIAELLARVQSVIGARS
ncbi:MAG: response regulator [Planctomycetes bacterium]|nr:response regulator [Planctomycetota bacterium]